VYPIFPNQNHRAKQTKFSSSTSPNEYLQPKSTARNGAESRFITDAGFAGGTPALLSQFLLSAAEEGAESADYYASEQDDDCHQSERDCARGVRMTRGEPR
jgi:hypothetical protein